MSEWDDLEEYASTFVGDTHGEKNRKIQAANRRHSATKSDPYAAARAKGRAKHTRKPVTLPKLGPL